MALQEGGSAGWPLGLQPLNIRLRLMEHFRLAESGPFFASTPSVTSESSSDLDTESTGSFFPEKSMTLGSLIGFQSNEQVNEARVGVLSAQTSRRKCSVHFRSWCGFIGCAAADARHESISPSLAYLLELERRSAASQRQDTITPVDTNVGEATVENQNPTTNTLFTHDRILPPPPPTPTATPAHSSASTPHPEPLGAFLKRMFERGSPGCSHFPAGDWTSSSDAVVGGSGEEAEGEGRGDATRSTATFWPTMCGQSRERQTDRQE